MRFCRCGSSERRIAPPLATEGLADVDAFLGTHNHLDHIDHEAWKIWTRAYPKAKFIFAEVHRKEVLDDGADPKEFADYLEAKYKGKVACRIPKIMERITV